MVYNNSEYPHQLIDALGIRTAYVSTGKPDGNPILLLHGMTSSSDIYREFMHAMEDQHWLIAPDIPGFGFSDSCTRFTFPHLVEWLAAFCDALGLPAMTVIGHSFGGALAASFALSYPEDVKRLLLIAPALLAGDMFPTYLKRAGISLGIVDLGTAVSQSGAIVQQQVRSSFYYPELQDDAVWERRLRDYELARASADVLKAIAFQDYREDLPRIHQPVCLLWGKGDPVLPVEHGHELAELIPNGQMVEFEECGHILMLEKQTWFQVAARAFLAGRDVNQAVNRQKTKDASKFNGPVISVFGSSAPEPGSQAYEQARQIGMLLAQKGFGVATGGYGGTMSAVSQGAAENGGHVIGVTCDQIEQFRPLGPNAWIGEERRFSILQERLIHLVRHNNGMIVLPGGIGTLSEMALAWSLLQVGDIEPRPLVLVGESWRETVSAFMDDAYIRPDHLELLTFADSPQSAVEALLKARE